jgi:hypothetical protein
MAEVVRRVVLVVSSVAGVVGEEHGSGSDNMT